MASESYYQDEMPCRVWFPVSATGKQRRRCGWPATVHVVAGCVHEHVWDGWLCQKHAASPSPCGACFVFDGHICPMIHAPAEGAA